MGKLIVIDGNDASGKETQTRLLLEYLAKKKVKSRLLTFPNYEADYSAPVRRYLKGDLGKNPADVGAYAASALYAVDRFCSFKTSWEKDYNSGTLLVADRYSTSNAIHQGAKLEGSEQGEFFRWLFEFEHGKIGLPKPDKVIFLNMPPKFSIELMEKRCNKATGEDKKDIHESDEKYLHKCYDTAVLAAKYYKWDKVDCINENGLLSLCDIHENIINMLGDFI